MHWGRDLRKRAYTLLELVVTIAVVSVLVALVVPNYKSYIIKSRVATVFPVMKHYSQLGQEYYEANGKFGNAQALGIDIGAATNLVANPTTINKYTSVQVVDVDGTALCYNNIRVTYNGTALGAPQDFDIQMLIRFNNGMYQISCGIPFDQNSATYADVLKYFPDSCRDQNVSSCTIP